MGTVWEEYQIVLDRLNMPASMNVLTGSGMSFMIGRVSYTFGYQGKPQMEMDLYLISCIWFAWSQYSYDRTSYFALVPCADEFIIALRWTSGILLTQSCLQIRCNTCIGSTPS